MKTAWSIRLIIAIVAFSVFYAPFLLPALCLDRVVKLYMCQTEHELEEITSWEYAAPSRFREATKNGTITPLDAARDRAALMISMDRITCDADGRITLAKAGSASSPVVLGVAELESYCPRTMKKQGHPCK